MTTPRSAVFVCGGSGTIFCRVEGWGTMARGLALRRFAERRLASGDTALRIDLSDCVYMDSTFLGTLICLSRSFGRRTPEVFALINPSPDCCQLLTKMKLETVLPVRQGEGRVPGEWVELRDTGADDDALQSCVVQAHQELAKVPGPTGEPFRRVVDLLRPDLQARDGR